MQQARTVKTSDFPDSLLVGVFVLVFMASVADCDGRIPVARGKRVKNSHINEGSFKTPPLPFHPEPIHCDA